MVCDVWTHHSVSRRRRANIHDVPLHTPSLHPKSASYKLPSWCCCLHIPTSLGTHADNNGSWHIPNLVCPRAIFNDWDPVSSTYISRSVSMAVRHMSETLKCLLFSAQRFSGCRRRLFKKQKQKNKVRDYWSKRKLNLPPNWLGDRYRPCTWPRFRGLIEPFESILSYPWQIRFFFFLISCNYLIKSK